MSTSKGVPTLADFSARTGAIFHADRDGQAFELLLTSTQDILTTDQQTNFSLEFVAPTDTPPEQGIYRLEDDELGSMDLFLVPVARDAEGLHFEAVFNHLHG